MVILGFSQTLLVDESLSAGARDGLERVKRMAKLGGYRLPMNRVAG